MLLALGVLTGAAGAGCSGDRATGGSCTLRASVYNQSCQTDSDCVAVFLGDVCQDVCHGECANEAINSADNNRYTADLNAAFRVQTSNPRTACSCALGPAMCRAGVCAVRSPVASAGDGGESE